ncbi:CD209 antigen-like protein E [Brachyistius frenatus]|uniref:CD209 antigen-like protein E n=1 Tax=Brachyistius frenatus TaxID=100188 RepID=UPI0037E76ED1
MINLLIMEEEPHYVTVIFKTNGGPTQEEPNKEEIIYDEVKTEELARDTQPLQTENKKKGPLCTPLTLVLGVICVILVSAVVALIIHFKHQQSRENFRRSVQLLQLQAEKKALWRRTEELAGQRDRLNWTIRVILQYDDFPVKTHCPHKVCKPCLDNWLLFQSYCYLFLKQWKYWQGSRDHCKENQADLVVIDSQEEQEFINNHTEEYYDSEHGYWIGLKKKNTEETWTWVDGSNSNVTYWKTQEAKNNLNCALSLPGADPQANWQKTGCDFRNRWICERRALIKSD